MGRSEEAREALDRALQVCERKGFIVGVQEARRLQDTPATKQI